MGHAIWPVGIVCKGELQQPPSDKCLSAGCRCISASKSQWRLCWAMGGGARQAARKTPRILWHGIPVNRICMPFAVSAYWAVFCKKHLPKPSRQASERLCYTTVCALHGPCSLCWLTTPICNMWEPELCTAAVKQISCKQLPPQLRIRGSADHCMLERHMSCAHLWKLSELARVAMVCGKALMLQQNYIWLVAKADRYIKFPTAALQ